MAMIFATWRQEDISINFNEVSGEGDFKRVFTVRQYGKKKDSERHRCGDAELRGSLVIHVTLTTDFVIH